MAKVYFIGAGPGDPELLTLKGKRVIENADIIIYAGSLVNEKILEFAHNKAVQIYNSAAMTLEEVVGIYRQYKDTDAAIARIHTGDTSLYSAIAEQIEWCEEQGIEYEVVPGVSSFCAAAAALKQELTLPGISQTVIITRASGRTAVPDNEDIARLAQIKATLIIFLSVDRIDEIVDKIACGYEKTTPVAVVYKASWDDERIIRGTLADISDKVKNEGIKRQALIIVGDVLKREGFEKSRLYAQEFTHLYRVGQK
ncbi:precorrin-4 C(11)-methyltransferase [bacterium]|nr:precorrin-4 C(11)-methyltransferase [bacterium]